MLNKIHHALQKAYPIDIGIQDLFETNSVGAFVEFRGEVVWKEVFSRSVLIDAPNDLVTREAYVAGRKCWSDFLDSHDWSTYWEQ